MEILRFEDHNDSPRARRKSSRVWVSLAFFGVVLGVGSAFASSTIAINGNNKVDLGQGVSVVTACDSAIGIRAQSGINESSKVAPTPTPTASGSPTPAPTFPTLTFNLTSLTLSDLNTTSVGCLNKELDLQIFHVSELTKVPYSCSDFSLSDVKINGTSISSDGGCDLATGSLFAKIHADSGSTSNLVFTFTSAPSDISDITVVSKDA